MCHGQYEVGGHSLLARLVAFLEHVDGHRLDSGERAQILGHGAGIAGRGGGEDADQHDMLDLASGMTARQPGADQAGDIADAQPERQALIDECIDAAMEIGQAAINSAQTEIALGDEGPGSGRPRWTCFRGRDRPGSSLRHADLLGSLTEGRRAPEKPAAQCHIRSGRAAALKGLKVTVSRVMASDIRTRWLAQQPATSIVYGA